MTELAGAWAVHFDPRWGGPDSTQFGNLESWTARDEPGIRYYSGTAVYHKTFSLPKPAAGKIFIDLGRVRELAEIKVNGRSCGIVWTPPFRADVTDAVKTGESGLLGPVRLLLEK